MPVLPVGSSSGIGLTSLSLPLVLPLLPSLATITVTFEDNIGVSTSPLDFTMQQFDWNTDRLSAKAVLPGGMDKSTGRAWVAFLAACRGRLNPFLLGDTSMTQPRGAASGTPLVNGASQSGRQLVSDGWLPSTQVLRSGDWIQIGTGVTQRLYMSLLDVTSDSSGNATIQIYPTLRESPADNAAIVTSTPQGVFCLASNQRSYSVDSALKYGISFDAMEYLVNA